MFLKMIEYIRKNKIIKKNTQQTLWLTMKKKTSADIANKIEKYLVQCNLNLALCRS